MIRASLSAAFLLACLLPRLAPAASGAAGGDEKKDEGPVWQQLVQQRNWAAAGRELRGLLIEAARKDQLKNAGAVAELFYWYSVSRHFPAMRERILKEELRAQLTEWLLKHRGFTETLLWSLSERDDPPKAFAVVADLVNRYDTKVVEFGNLATAFATVYDTSNYDPDHVREAFRYYVAESGSMVYNVKTLPVPLCKYLVDGKAPAREKAWALGLYKGRKNVASLCDVVRLDEAAYRDSRHARLKGKEVTLANIKRYGAAHRLRVYFATEVGKAIGIPCTPMAVEGEVYRTSWVAYLYRGAAGPRWRYGAGREFELDEEDSGAVDDPKENRAASADDLERDAASMGLNADERRRFALYTGVASMLLADDGEPLLPGEKRPPAAPDALPVLDTALRLAGKALEIDPLAPEPWTIRTRATARMGDGGRTILDKSFDALYADRKLAKHPHSRVRVFSLLLDALPEKDHAARIRHCRRMLGLLQREKVLQAQVKLLEGSAVLASGKDADAFKMLSRAAVQHAKDGFIVLGLLRKAEDLARDRNELNAAIKMYESALALITRPRQRAQWAKGTVYYRALDRLSRLHRDAGNLRKVDELTAKMKSLARE